MIQYQKIMLEKMQLNLLQNNKSKLVATDPNSMQFNNLNGRKLSTADEISKANSNFNKSINDTGACQEQTIHKNNLAETKPQILSAKDKLLQNGKHIF